MTRLLAILGPVVLFAALGAALFWPAEAVTEAPLPLPARVLDGRLKAVENVDVVLLGNSKVGTDLDPEAIGRLYPEGAGVVPLGVKGTGMPVWYAVLHDRVYAAGYEPKLVIVYATLQMMAQTQLPSDAQRARLAEVATGAIPALDQKVYGKGMADPRMQLALARRGEWHRSLLDGTRDLAVGLFLAPAGAGGVGERGAAYAEPAFASLFSSENQKEATRHVGPVVEQELSDATAGDGVMDTLIPDLLTLAHSHGAQVLFVRAPLAASKVSVDSVPPELEPEVIRLLAHLGDGYLDLRDADLTASAYGDGVHLSTAGRGRFTPQFLEAVAAVGVGTGRMTPAAPQPPKRVLTGTRAGTPPQLATLSPYRTSRGCGYIAPFTGLPELADHALAAAGLGQVSPLVVLEDATELQTHALGNVVDTCVGASGFVGGRFKFSPTGPGPESAERHQYRAALTAAAPARGGEFQEVWWVYPGTELTVTVPDPAGAGAGKREVRVEVAAPVRGVAAPTVRLGEGAAVALDPFGSGYAGNVVGPAGEDAWTFTVASPSDGPYVLLQRVVTGPADAPVYLIGKPARRGQVSLLAGEVEAAAEPPSLSGDVAAPVAGREPGLWLFDVSGFAVPSHDQTYKSAGTGCSPMQLILDGARLVGGRTAPGKPRLGHAGGQLRVNFPAEFDATAAHTYAVALDPDRACGSGAARWLYPGDELTFSVDAEPLQRLVAGADSLELGGAAVPASGALEVSLSVDGAEVYATTVDLAHYPPPPMLLPTRVSPAAASAELRLRLPSGYLLVTSADLSEPAPPPFGP